MTGLARAAGLNVAKKLTRPIAPPIQKAIEAGMGHQPPGSIDRLWSDRIDVSALDGGLCFVSTAAEEVLKLNDGAGYDARLQLRGDLPAVIGKYQGTVPVDKSAASAAQYLGTALPSIGAWAGQALPVLRSGGDAPTLPSA